MLTFLRSLIVGTLLLTAGLLSGQAHTLNHGVESRTPPPLTACGAGNCSANAGGDFTVCTSEVIQLNGALPDGEDNLVEWIAAEGNPALVSFSDPFVLDPFVNPDVGFRTLAIGEYTFTIMVTCPDGTISCDDVLVTVGEIGPVSISDDIVGSCENEVTINASPPGPNVNGRWSLQPFDADVTLEEEGSNLTITRNETGNRDCELTLTYEWSIGGCTETLSTSVSFIQSYESVSARAPFVSCRTARVFHTIPGCASTIIWNLLEGPNDDVTISGESPRTSIVTVTEPGEYTFSFSIDNGECPSSEDTFIITFPEECAPTCPDIFGPAVFLQSCLPFHQISEFTLSGPAHAGFTYEWELSNAEDLIGINVVIQSPSSPATQVNIQTSPDGYIREVIRFRLIARSIAHPECVEALGFLVIPPAEVEVIEPVIYYNCGGPSGFNVRNNIEGYFNRTSYRILSAPEDFEIGSQGAWTRFTDATNIDLRVPGSFVFEVQGLSEGADLFNPTQEISCPDIETFTVIVNDIPNISAGADQEICATSTQLNGNPPEDSDGLPVDIPVLWEQLEGPGVSISDVNVPDPEISGLTNGTTYRFRYSYPSDGDCVRESTVEVNVLSEKDCEEPPRVCDFTLSTRCTTCGCSQDLGIGTIRDTYGNTISSADYSISWEVDGQSVVGNTGTYIVEYDGPVALSATVSYTEPDGTVCLWTDAVAVNCLGDCPLVSFRTCNDPGFEKMEECEKYFSGCSFGNFEGYVWAVDQAGNVIDDYGIRWNIEGNVSIENPHYVNYLESEQYCEGIPVSVIRQGEKTCEEDYIFTYDCCMEETIYTRCVKDQDALAIDWYGNPCQTESYEVTVACSNGSTEVYTVEAATYNYFQLPASNSCKEGQYVTVRARCAKGELGPASVCIYVSESGCVDYNQPCSSLGGGKAISVTPVVSEAILYPNPASGNNATIVFASKDKSAAKAAYVTLRNYSGQKQRRVEVGANVSALRLNLEGLKAGVYFVTVTDADGLPISVHRLVKM